MQLLTATPFRHPWPSHSSSISPSQSSPHTYPSPRHRRRVTGLPYQASSPMRTATVSHSGCEHASQRRDHTFAQPVNPTSGSSQPVTTVYHIWQPLFTVTPASHSDERLICNRQITLGILPHLTEVRHIAHSHGNVTGKRP